MSERKLKNLVFKENRPGDYSADCVLGRIQLRRCISFEHKNKWFLGINLETGILCSSFEDGVKRATDEYARRVRACFEDNVPKKIPNAMDFFDERVDTWGPAQWFQRLVQAVRAQDDCVLAKQEVSFETFKSIAASSATRLVRDYADSVSWALSNNLTPVAIRHDFDGHGYQYMDAGSGSDWLTRRKEYPEFERLYKHETQNPPAPLRIFRHVKSGGDYEFLGIGRLQASDWFKYNHFIDMGEMEKDRVPVDMEPVAIYRAVSDGLLWVRALAEWRDGRFVELETTRSIPVSEARYASENELPPTSTPTENGGHP